MDSRLLSAALLAAVVLLSAVRAQSRTSGQDTPGRSALCTQGVQQFERIALLGTADCTCSGGLQQAQCSPLRLYPAVAAQSPEGLLAQEQRPASSQVQLLQYQIQSQCFVLRLQGRRCAVTWPTDGSWAPVCDCAKGEAPQQIRRNFYVQSATVRHQA